MSLEMLRLIPPHRRPTDAFVRSSVQLLKLTADRRGSRVGNNSAWLCFDLIMRASGQQTCAARAEILSDFRSTSNRVSVAQRTHITSQSGSIRMRPRRTERPAQHKFVLVQ